jgi:hypothetical protein
MASDEPDHSERFVSMIQRVREQAQQARSEYHAATVQGGVSDQVRRRLAWAALDYYDTLSEFDDQQHVQELWQADSLQQLAEAAETSVSVPSDSPGDSTSTGTDQVPAVLFLDAKTIYEAVKQLDKIAYRLGFAAKPTKRTERVNPEPV